MASISQNSLYLISGSVIQKILGFIYFIFLARFLGPESVGKYTFAISFTTIFSIFIDWGLNQVLIRSVAQNQTKTRDYFYNILAIKLIFSAFIYLVIILIVNLMGYPEITKKLVYLAALVTILDNVSSTIFSVLRGFQNLKYESIGLALYEVIILSVGLIILYSHLPLPYIIFPLIFASSFYLVFGLFCLAKKYQIKPALKFNHLLIKQLIKITTPFFLAGIFGTLFSYIDVVLLSQLAGDKFVGFYSTASKLLGGLRILPIAFTAALYPTACLYFVSNKDLLKKIIEKSISYLILLSLPITIGLWVLADQVIIFVYGDKFLPAVSSLRIVACGLLFVFLDYVFFAILNAGGQEKKNVFNRGVAMITIILFNFLLIPSLKHIGSAMAFTLSFALLTLLGGLKSQKLIGFSMKNILIYFFQVLVVSLVMGVIILLLKSMVNFVILIFIGFFIYLISLLISGLITKEDFRYFKSLIGFIKIHR